MRVWRNPNAWEQKDFRAGHTCPHLLSRQQAGPSSYVQCRQSADEWLRGSSLLGTWIVSSALEATLLARAPSSSSDTRQPLDPCQVPSPLGLSLYVWKIRLLSWTSHIPSSYTVQSKQNVVFKISKSLRSFIKLLSFSCFLTLSYMVPNLHFFLHSMTLWESPS